MFGALLQVALLLIALVVAVLLVGRLWRWTTGRPGLVLDQLVDGTGDEASAKQLPGNTELFRHRLADELRVVARDIARTKLMRKSPGRVNAPLPGSVRADFIQQLGAGKDALPEPMKSLAALGTVLLPRRTLQVTGAIQKSAERGMGLTATVSDLRRPEADAVATIWERRQPEEPAPSAIDSAVRVVQELVAGPPEQEPEPPPDDAREAWTRPAAFWTAVILTKFELRDRHPAIHERAQVANYAGYLLATRAHKYGWQFFGLAIPHFEEAIELDPDWFTPHENLADALSFLGDATADQGLQLKSIQGYEEALKRVGNTWAWARPDIGERKGAVKARERQVRVAKAISQLLSGSEKRRTESSAYIERLTQGRDASDARWSRYTEDSADVLNSLASWYAVAIRVKLPVQEAFRTAAEYVLLAAVASRRAALADEELHEAERYRDYIDHAKEDDDLRGLKIAENEEAYRRSVDELWSQRSDSRSLPKRLRAAAGKLTTAK